MSDYCPLFVTEGYTQNLHLVIPEDIWQLVPGYINYGCIFSYNFEIHMQYPEGHVSQSMYGIFRLVNAPNSCNLLAEFFPNLCLTIWTTTPWTIPANAGEILFLIYFFVK